MTDSFGSSDCVPCCVDAAPRVSLVMLKGSSGSTTLKCRRIVTYIGSRPGCRIVLKHRHVDPVHVAIVNDGFEVHAVDLVTQRHTRLNGLNMEHERLGDGDLLSIANWEFRVDITQPTSESEGVHDEHSFSMEPTPTIVALEHIASGRILKPSRDICVIGRRNGCDISLTDRKVSRVHALIIRYFGQPALVDLNSRHGLVVNDQPITFHMLRDGDMITIGETKFRARLLGAAMLQHASNSNGKAHDPVAPRLADTDLGIIELESVDELTD